VSTAADSTAKASGSHGPALLVAFKLEGPTADLVLHGPLNTLLLTWKGASWNIKCTRDFSPLRMDPMRARNTCGVAHSAAKKQGARQAAQLHTWHGGKHNNCISEHVASFMSTMLWSPLGKCVAQQLLRSCSCWWNMRSEVGRCRPRPSYMQRVGKGLTVALCRNPWRHSMLSFPLASSSVLDMLLKLLLPAELLL